MNEISRLEHVERFKENDYDCVLLDTQLSTQRFFKTIVEDNNFLGQFLEYWNNHLNCKAYVFENILDDNEVPLCFPQSVILLDQIRQTRKQKHLYTPYGYKERLERDAIKGGTPIVFMINELQFSVDNRKEIIGLGYRNRKEKRILRYNISKIGGLDDFIYPFPVKTDTV